MHYLCDKRWTSFDELQNVFLRWFRRLEANQVSQLKLQIQPWRLSACQRHSFERHHIAKTCLRMFCLIHSETANSYAPHINHINDDSTIRFGFDSKRNPSRLGRSSLHISNDLLRCIAQIMIHEGLCDETKRERNDSAQDFYEIFYSVLVLNRNCFYNVKTLP